MKPIGFVFPVGLGPSTSFRISCTNPIRISSWSLTRFSSKINFFDNCSFAKAISRRRINARTIKTLILFARDELKILAACSAPCSVNTKGNFRRPPHEELDVAICDFKSSNSCLVNWNIKSAGNLSIFLRTCSFNRLVSTPYNRARSASRITFSPRTRMIIFKSCFSEGIVSGCVAIIFALYVFTVRPVETGNIVPLLCHCPAPCLSLPGPYLSLPGPYLSLPGLSGQSSHLLGLCPEPGLDQLFIKVLPFRVHCFY